MTGVGLCPAGPRSTIQSGGHGLRGPTVGWTHRRATEVIWGKEQEVDIWTCSEYSDLRAVPINNLAQYGQPFRPDQAGYLPGLHVNFSALVVEMSQQEVMTNGYGRDITIRHFPLAVRFLAGELPVPAGRHTLASLIRHGYLIDKARRIRSAGLYGLGLGPNALTSGGIPRADAAYIHGTVGFALMKDETTFLTVPGVGRVVDAEIGAGDDNWDFESSTVPDWLNTLTAKLVGPKVYNLKKPITIRFTGPGKRSSAFQQQTPDRSPLTRPPGPGSFLPPILPLPRHW